jgi:RNA polymerase sigma factor (sigma-70 family)
MPENAQLRDQNVKMGMRLLEGDESVLEDILRTFGPQIKRFLIQNYEFCFNKDDIEDILSTALFKLWEFREDYDERKGSIRSLLFKIADNVAKDILKSGWKKAKKLEVCIDSDILRRPEIAEPSTVKNNSDICLSESDKKRLEDLKLIISNLPEVKRYIIMADAHARDGKADSGHLADELKIPRGTVLVNRKRALDKIKEELRRLGHKLP